MSVIVVQGRPVSANNRGLAKQRWKRQVATEGARVFSAPLMGSDLRIIITFFYEGLPDFDTDNISKPICDALKGVAFRDDRQLMERYARRRHIGGSFRIKGVDPGVAVALAGGQEFVAIKIEELGAQVVEI